MTALIAIFSLLTVVILSMWVVDRVWKAFTFSVPLVAKKEDNLAFYVMIAVDAILGIIILINL